MPGLRRSTRGLARRVIDVEEQGGGRQVRRGALLSCVVAYWISGCGLLRSRSIYDLSRSIRYPQPNRS
jgi:hypothetical protein